MIGFQLVRQDFAESLEYLYGNYEIEDKQSIYGIAITMSIDKNKVLRVLPFFRKTVGPYNGNNGYPLNERSVEYIVERMYTICEIIGMGIFDLTPEYLEFLRKLEMRIPREDYDVKEYLQSEIAKVEQLLA